MFITTLSTEFGYSIPNRVRHSTVCTEALGMQEHASLLGLSCLPEKRPNATKWILINENFLQNRTILFLGRTEKKSSSFRFSDQEGHSSLLKFIKLLDVQAEIILAHLSTLNSDYTSDTPTHELIPASSETTHRHTHY